jgi:predicted transcriptional regulator
MSMRDRLKAERPNIIRMSRERTAEEIARDYEVPEAVISRIIHGHSWAPLVQAFKAKRKMTRAHATEMRRLRNSGMEPEEIAEETGFSTLTVRRVLRGDIWKIRS